MTEAELAAIEARARLVPEELSQDQIVALCEEIHRLRVGIEAMRPTTHDTCDDPYYSCPASGENPVNGPEQGCWCFNRPWNDKIDALLGR